MLSPRGSTFQQAATRGSVASGGSFFAGVPEGSASGEGGEGEEEWAEEEETTSQDGSEATGPIAGGQGIGSFGVGSFGLSTLGGGGPRGSGGGEFADGSASSILYATSVDAGGDARSSGVSALSATFGGGGDAGSSGHGRGVSWSADHHEVVPLFGAGASSFFGSPAARGGVAPLYSAPWAPGNPSSAGVGALGLGGKLEEQLGGVDKKLDRLTSIVLASRGGGRSRGASRARVSELQRQSVTIADVSGDLRKHEGGRQSADNPKPAVADRPGALRSNTGNLSELGTASMNMMLVNSSSESPVNRGGKLNAAMLEMIEEIRSRASNRRSTKRSSQMLAMDMDAMSYRRRVERTTAGRMMWSLWQQLDNSTADTFRGKAMVILILMSVIYATWLTTQPDSSFNLGWESYIEITIDVIFALELFLRFLVSPLRGQFLKDFHNVADIVACSNSVLRLVTLTSSWNQAEFRRILRASAPGLRLIKTVRYFETFNLLLRAFAHALEALPVILFTQAILVFLFSAMLFLCEASANDNLDTFPEAVWLTIVTMMTVGYGDSTAITSAGRIVSSVLIVVSGLYTAIPFGIVGSAFGRVWEDRDRLLLTSRTRQLLIQGGYRPEDLRWLFQVFDKNNSGLLSIDEFKIMIEEMRIGLREDRIVDLFYVFDSNGSGGIDVHEFIAGMFPGSILEEDVEKAPEVAPSKKKGSVVTVDPARPISTGAQAGQ